MSAADKKEAAVKAARAATQASHAASNAGDAVEAVAEYTKDEVADFVKIRSTPLSIAAVVVVTVGSALAIRGGREIVEDLRKKRTEFKAKAAAKAADEAVKPEETP